MGRPARSAVCGPSNGGSHRGRGEEARRLERVQVCSHSRQRQKVVTVMTFASVSMILPLQDGHIAGRATISVCMTHAGGFSPLRLFKSEQPSRCLAYDGCDERCSAIHCGLIHPRLPWAPRPAARALWMIHAALAATRTAMGNHIVMMRQALAPVMASIVPDRAARVCAVVHICARFEGASESEPPS